MNTNKIVEMITASDSVGIGHTWFYRAFGFRLLEKHAGNNALVMYYDNKNNPIHEGFVYFGKYEYKMIFELLSKYYDECFRKGDLVEIEDSEIIGIGADYWPSSQIAADIDKCISKTVKDWYDEIKNMDDIDIVNYLNYNGGGYADDIVTEDNAYEVKEGILEWLKDNSPYGASALISSTIIYDTVQQLKPGILTLNEYAGAAS